MKDHPGISVKKKRDASIVVATDLLRQKNVMPLFFGKSGAAVASALFGLGRIKGIERPAIATVIPSLTGATGPVGFWCQGGRKTGAACPKCHHGIGLC